MPIGEVHVEVLQAGDRAEELLSALGARLQTSSIRERDGRIARFWFDNATADEAYDAVQGALDAVGGDWTAHLAVQRPAS